MKYILSLDQGTTSSRAILFDGEGRLRYVAQKEFTQIFPQSGWVEHDPEEIWKTQSGVMRDVLSQSDLSASDLIAVSITNQRETTVVWDRHSGQPIHNALVWQDKRTADLCARMKADGLEAHVRNTTGLVIDAYFSATKLAWLLDQVPGARARAEKGELLFGTIDTWLIWNLTKGAVHATDPSNASRTMLYDIHQKRWDPVLLDYLNIPSSVLPEVRPSSAEFGTCALPGGSVAIRGVLGDQQAALFGQACFETGMAKNTYGTGCFLLMNTGSEAGLSKSGLINTIAWGIGDQTTYALEGSIFIGGAVVQWLRDGLRLLDHAEDSEYLAGKVDDDQVYLVPAFAGLGAPYWDMYARGAIFGLTRDTSKKHIARAALQSMAYQSRDVLEAMEQDSGASLKTLRVDGGAAANNLLMQFQSDILGVPVDRPTVLESTALGAAYMGGLGAGFWDMATIAHKRQVEHLFQPHMPEDAREKLYSGWKKAVMRTMHWLDE